MAKVTLDNLATTLANSAAAAINANNDDLEAAFENTLSRDGTGPNQMLADFDMNNNDILNVKDLDVDSITLNGVLLVASTATTISPGAITTNLLADGAVTTAKIASGSITDILLNASSNVGVNNSYITTPAFHGGSIQTMFAAAGYKVYIIPAGTYTFSAAFTIPNNSIIIAQQGAIFQPTFEPVGGARATPLITVGTGCIINYIKLALTTGIDTIRIGVKVQSNTQIDYFEATSVDLNNNRTEPGSTDLISGALLIQGAEHVRIGQVYLSRFDRGWAVIDSTDVVIQKIRNLETVMGGYIHGSRDIHVITAYSTGPIDPTLPNAFGRGVMTPGANSVVLAGCSDSSFGTGGWFAYDILEHGIRVGQVASGTTVPNHRIAFGNINIFRSYGTGFKTDDADDFNIKKITIESLYTEDIGRGNWFGTGGYTNWSTGVNNPSINNDGNKEACAIRNAQYVTVGTFQNRVQDQTESGYIGFWVERSNHVTARVDTDKSRTAGIQVQSGGTTSPEEILITGRTSNNLGAGVKFEATASDAVWRGVIVDVDSQGNGTWDFEVTANLSGTSPFATKTSRIAGFARGGASGLVNVASVVLADTDFIDDVEANGTFTPSITFATPGDLSLSSVTASGNWKRRGRYVTVECSYTGTPTYTTASGDFRVTGLPFAAASSLSTFNIQGSGVFTWPASRTQIFIHPVNANTFCTMRGLGTGVSNSAAFATAQVPSATAVTINFAGEYRI